ncbi:MAG TPA: ABC transporter permease, partial [Nannocystaceae bacterium]|nr:ABC transporter permease [Nannocystaceae bacterium]
GLHHPMVAFVLFVASLLFLASLALVWFPPAMAVSVVGIALSCASLMTALGVTTGFIREISRAVARFNGHVLVTKYGLDFREYDQVAADVMADPRVVAASPFAFSMIAVVPEHGTAEGSLAAPIPAAEPAKPSAGVDEDDDAWDAALAEPAPVASTDPLATGDGEEGPAIVVGKGLDPERAKALSGLTSVMGRGDLSALVSAGTNRSPGIVLGHALARELGVGIGDRVRVVVPAELDGDAESGRLPPRHAVFDVLDLVDTGIAEFDRNLALMHITAAQALFFREDRVTGIEFELLDPDLAEAVAADLAWKLPPLYRTSTWQEANSAMLTMLQQIRVVLVLVLGLMVLTGAASLIASLLLIVRRKQRDIAVLLAIGCDHRGVFWVFESVGLLAGAVGSLAGIALGGIYCFAVATYRFPLALDVYPVDHLPVAVQLADVVVPVVAALGLCALASGPVALLATRVRPVVALAGR